MLSLILFFLFLMGLCVGSFANVCIYRIPLRKSVVRPRSFCPHCQGKISWYDNIPLVSYLLLKGQCRSCKAEIPWQYPVVELLLGLLSVAVYLYMADPWEYAAYYFLFVTPLVILSFIDLKHMVIPDIISLPGIVAGFFTYLQFSGRPYPDAVLKSFLGLLLGGSLLFLIGWLYQRLRKVEGIGGGDVKLMAMIGAFLGAESVVFVLMISAFVGALIGVVIMFFQRKDTKLAIPYGPFLSLAALLYLFYGPPIIRWYFGFFSLP